MGDGEEQEGEEGCGKELHLWNIEVEGAMTKHSMDEDNAGQKTENL